MTSHRRTTRGALIGATALAGALVMLASPVVAQESSYSFEIPSQSLDTALRQYSRTTNQQLIFADADVRGRRAPALNGAYSAEDALQVLLAGTQLKVNRTARGVVQIAEDAGPQGESAAGGGAEVEALVVTAQKREEAIQDVPIAISAFSQKALEEQKIEGGFDLLKAIPNVTFSKSNFSSYNFSIRGIGTKAISATTDPGVAVAFNNTTLIQNRLFEQEYFDVERVEVLRGPQGTLYGRNATSGVINVITAKPDLNDIAGSIKLEGGSFDTQRVVGMVNIPVIDDVLAIRAAGAMTKRSGYDFNEITGNDVNGRDLWSGRISVGFEPAPAVRANFIWEHFEEEDNRSRTGKQLCHRDPGPEMIGSIPLVSPTSTDPVEINYQQVVRRAVFSQGCKPGSLYDDAAFGTPNGAALPFVFAILALQTPSSSGAPSLLSGLGKDPITGQNVSIIQPRDPYGGAMQTPDLRTIASFRDPIYRAKADLLELSVDIDLTDSLTFTSQTAYNEDVVYSFQDFNRFNTEPIFADTSVLVNFDKFGNPSPSKFANLAPGGVFCDPQIGCTDRLAGYDISQAKGRQFSQEFRLQSNFDGPVNFSAGANYTQFKTLIDYYVFFNVLTVLAATPPFNDTGGTTTCAGGGFYQNSIPGPLPITDPRSQCPYIDPNPVNPGENFEGDGHNYFRSKNPYELTSAAAFGELYWNVTEDLKLTAGLRYTDDTKTFTPVPSQVLLAQGYIAGGTVSIGYPSKPDIEQQWGEFTGRIGLDWKPALSFTDETLLYGFYSRGYKAGGANPPSPGFATADEVAQMQIAAGGAANGEPVISLTAVEYGRTFDAEFVNAFEIGAKNTLLGGAATFNATAFYYDYSDYQVSQIRDRTAVNENFDATIWGLEFEALYAPTRDLRINANLGYLNTRIADGETSIDIMDRTAGDPNYVVTKAWAQLPSNCVIPVSEAESWASFTGSVRAYWLNCGGLGNAALLAIFGSGNWFDFDNYPELNGGAGIRKQLGGNELPNAPHWTANVGAQYSLDIMGGWRTTVRTDVYWQAQSYHRVYNFEPYDKLHGWYNVNLSVWAEQPDWGVKVELYAKNLLDDTPITDAFLNSDDTALTTNVFTLDPRVIGLSVRKTF